MTPMEMTPENLKEWLKPVTDPELHLSLVELGLIYRCEAQGEKVNVDMTLTSPACPAGDMMINDVKTRLMELEGVKEVDVEIVWEPKWDPKTMASEEAKEILGIW